MRSLAFAPAFLIIGSFALAGGAPTIDLDRPGALDQLKHEHPQRYQAVSALLRAFERAPCQNDQIELLETRLNVEDLECGMIVFTTYPAQRHVSFELDGIGYAATVVLEDVNTVRPLSTEMPVAAH
jgi:hypothetical protein